MHPAHSVIRPHNPRKPAFMEKSKYFYHSRFPAEVIDRADQKLRGHAQGENCELKYYTLSVEDADDDAN
jgi:hypothetical protein